VPSVPGPPAVYPALRVRLRAAWSWARTRDGQVRLAWAITLLLIALDILLVGQHALVRYQAYRADAFDLGNMDQAVWNTLHGHPFRFTNTGLDWRGPPTRLGIHVEPILFLIAPLYLIHSGPETLLVLQTVALALGGLPLFALSLRRLPELPLVGTALVAAYLVAPEMLGEALWDFHPVALATPLLLVTIWALDARRYGWLLLAAALAALTKEDVGLALVPLGLYLAVWQRKPRLGIPLAALAALWVAICFRVILPHFNGGEAGGNNYWYRYAWLGSTPGTAIVNVLTHPWLPVIGILGDAAKRGYLAILLRTGGGLGIFAPALWICGLPELAVNILSSHEEQYSSFFQYNAMLLAFLMGAAVYGTEALYRARLRAEGHALPSTSATTAAGDTGANGLGTRLAALGARWEGLVARVPLPSRWLGPALVVWLVVSSYWNLAVATARIPAFWHAGDAPNPQQTAINTLLARVPASASVAATDTLDPHLSDRYTLYLMPDPRSFDAEYVAVDLPDAIALSQPTDAQMLEYMLISGRYTVVGTAGPVLLLHRTGPALHP
jgi:uncharacterized membrane protein